MSNNNDKLEKLFNTGSELLGGSVGSTLGFLCGGPGGALIGGAVSPIITSLLKEITSRSLSNREEARIGAAALLATEKIRKKLEIGEQLRQDTWFQTQQGTSRSNAEEIFEGVLLKSKNEHEEKKVQFIANIFVNIAFSPGLNIGEANHILQLAETLTYRQICLLALFQQKDKIPEMKLLEKSYTEVKTASKASLFDHTISLLQEIYQLYSFGLISHSVIGGAVIPAPLTNWERIVPTRVTINSAGERLYSVMSLDEISPAEIHAIAVLLASNDTKND